MYISYNMYVQTIWYWITFRDQKLASTPEFTEFLRILASAESEVDEKILSEIQKQFSDKFQEWTKVSQLRVGFLMHLDKRINSSQYLDKVVHHLTSTYDIAGTYP